MSRHRCSTDSFLILTQTAPHSDLYTPIVTVMHVTDHSWKSEGFPSAVATMRQPWAGGLDHIRLHSAVAWLLTAPATSGEFSTQHSSPTRSSGEVKGQVTGLGKPKRECYTVTVTAIVTVIIPHNTIAILSLYNVTLLEPYHYIPCHWNQLAGGWNT